MTKQQDNKCSVHNQSIYKSVQFDSSSGDEARILEQKDQIDEGAQKIRKGYKLLTRKKDVEYR